MGIFRLYLALCVAVSHAGEKFPLGPHRGHEAVQIFFMISGFYMAMVYGKYSSNKEFFFSRFIRIFVPYWTICLGIVVVSLAMGVTYGIWVALDTYMDAAKQNETAGVILVTLSNFTIFGQDLVMFLSHDLGKSLSFTSDYSTSANPLWRYLVIPQTWSVSIELMFYLCIPWLLKRSSKTLIYIISLSVLARICVYLFTDFPPDPWRFRFFPFELALFIGGILSFRFFNQHSEFFSSFGDRWAAKSIGGYLRQTAILLFLFWLSSCFTRLGLKVFSTASYLELISYFFMAAAIPFLFSLSKSNKVDRFIGELSYPVYLVHVFVISAMVVILPYLGNLNQFKYGLFTSSAIVSVALSICVLLLVINPLDKVRYQLSKRWSKKF
jgi:peptidoglycan/LPS O-acetylase OafA/YrhL